ncbi:MAG TPA: hypothetical protein VKT53_09345 [Candidatus Acidoferrum sp.]|nr:hypothetical protein [Candidatus Acidoferrum sp.]
MKKIFLVFSCLFVLVKVSAARPTDDPCDLPKDLKATVEQKYPGTKVVSLSDLSEGDRKLFQKGHAGCPGLVNVDFYGDGKPTLALALTSKGNTEPKTKLVIAHRAEDRWQATTLDKTDGPIPVVWSEAPGEYKDVYGRKRIIAATPVIVFCGYSSWAVLYYWTDNKVSKIWVKD